MDRSLYITTLGSWSVTLDGAALPPLHSRKADALLAYLACTRRPQSRVVLADLLWDDVPTERALANLSVLLNSLRKHLAPWFTITRQQVAFVPSAACQLDVAQLEAAIVSAGNEPLNRLAAAQLEAAMQLYGGDFLHGLHVRAASGFETWQLAEQERLRQLVLGAGIVLLKSQIQLRAYQRGIEQARHLLPLDPYHESLNQLLLLLYTYNGQRGAALAHYQHYTQLLHNDLGVEPPATLAALHEQISHNSLAAAGMELASASSFRPVPVGAAHPATSMVDRETELRQIAERLAAPACRLLTLLGPGGSGKTRLAMQSSSDIAGNFADGVIFVDLAPLESADALPTTLALVLQLPLQATGDPEQQVIHHLARRHMLLVLDNFEHLLDGALLINRLLAATERLKILVTSRESLELAAEWLFDVGGLAVPPTESPPQPLESYGAVRLFVQRALQLQPAFRLNAATIPAVVSICRIVEGLPLALELAAAQIRRATLESIAAAVTASADALSTTLRDVPARHRSMRAVFDYSWQLLTVAEQQLLMRLSVLRGHFDLAAAAAVANTKAASLTGLQRASLLRHDERGYSLHELTRQYAAERLAASADEQASQQRHAYYFAGLVQRYETALNQNKAARDRLFASLDNICVAWVWASQQPDVDVLIGMAEGFSRCFQRMGLYQEGERYFRQAAVRIWAWLVGRRDSSPQHLRAALLILYNNIFFLTEQARYHEAHAQLDLAQGWLQQTADPELHARYLLLHGQLRYLQYDGKGAIELLQQALPFIQQTALPDLEALCSKQLSVALWLNSEPAQAIVIGKQALALYRQQQNHIGEGIVLMNLGNLLMELGEFEEARRSFEQSLALYRSFDDPIGAVETLDCLAMLAWEEGNYSDAERWYQQAVQSYEQIGNRRMLSMTLMNLAFNYRDTGQLAQAQDCFKRSLELGQRGGDQPVILWNLLGLAIVQRDMGDYEASHHLFQQCQQQVSGEEYKINSWLGIHQSLLALQCNAQVTAQQQATAALAAARQSSDRSSEALALLVLGHALVEVEQIDEASAAYAAGADLREQLGQRHLLLEFRAAQAHLAQLQGDVTAAQNHVEAVLTDLQQPPHGTEEPARIYLTCYKVLAAQGDPRARQVLRQGQQFVRQRATMLPNDSNRRNFLEGVAAHRALLALG
jgi:predicted ATPase/DNA-binding SARP family transcriptional activator/predicted negative regulator of RcsB-dependent stress response